MDDVMTTGSTAAACAAALKRAGAAKVALLTIARVDRRMDVWQVQTGGDRRGRERLNAERTIAKAGAGAERQL